MIAIIHPGQGSQQLGMFDGFQSNIFKDTITEASDILHLDLQKIADKDSPNDLILAENSQVCITALSVAIERLWRHNTGVIDFRAGHSIGEFAAYSSAGCFSFKDLLETVRYRTEVMADAFPVWEGCMMKVKDTDTLTLKKLMEGFDIEIACYNTPDTHIVSGLKRNIDDFRKFLDDKKVRTVYLNISLPCHSRFMIPAVEKMRTRLNAIKLSTPFEPVVSCYHTQVVHDEASIITGLSEQMAAPLNWVDNIKFLVKQHVDKFVVFGPKIGDYHRMIQSIFPEIKTYIVSDDDSLERTLYMVKDYE